MHVLKNGPLLQNLLLATNIISLGVVLLQKAMQVAVEGLLYSNFSLQSWCVHTEDSGKRLILRGVLGTSGGQNYQ